MFPPTPLFNGFHDRTRKCIFLSTASTASVRIIVSFGGDTWYIFMCPPFHRLQEVVVSIFFVSTAFSTALRTCGFLRICLPIQWFANEITVFAVSTAFTNVAVIFVSIHVPTIYIGFTKYVVRIYLCVYRFSQRLSRTNDAFSQGIFAFIPLLSAALTNDTVSCIVFCVLSTVSTAFKHEAGHDGIYSCVCRFNGSHLR